MADMSADIVDIKAARIDRANGNGAREAMASALSHCFVVEIPPGVTETILMRLWEFGFKVVPLDDEEKK